MMLLESVELMMIAGRLVEVVNLEYFSSAFVTKTRFSIRPTSI